MPLCEHDDFACGFKHGRERTVIDPKQEIALAADSWSHDRAIKAKRAIVENFNKETDVDAI